MITPDVLIPRPETELLVEKALDWLSAKRDCCSVIDSGTGSGCIAIALATNNTKVSVIACDWSTLALNIARKNVEIFNLKDRIELVLCDLFPPISNDKHNSNCLSNSGQADMLVANLPYIPSADLWHLKIYGREPRMALDGGIDGLELIRRYLDQAPMYIKPNGLILMEIEASQGTSVLTLANEKFPGADIHIHPDLSGRDRLLEIEVRA